MSKRRNPGEVVRRANGTAGFVATLGAESLPMLLRVPSGKIYEFDCILVDGEWRENPGGEASYCMMGCEDPNCREWANVEVTSEPFAGKHLYHVSECQMEDVV